MIPPKPPPPPSADYGYTCQCWLKTEIDQECFKPPWIWFSTKFGSWCNVDSSNPGWLYIELSRVVFQKDVGNRLVRDLRSNMLRSIAICGLTPVEKSTLLSHVIHAPVSEFQSRVWRIDLKEVARARAKPLSRLMIEWRANAAAEVGKNPYQVLQPEEYLIKDLIPTTSSVEYEVIIEV
jgi:hypothetical protein